MVTPPSDYFSALSLSRNLSVGRLPADTGCPDTLAMFHVYSLPEIPKSSCCPWSLCPLYLPSHNYTGVHARTHSCDTHTHTYKAGAKKKKITWCLLLVCLSHKSWSTALKLKRKEISRVRKMTWIQTKIWITNRVALCRRQAFVFLGQPAKNSLTRSCTSCLWDAAFGWSPFHCFPSKTSPVLSLLLLELELCWKLSILLLSLEIEVGWLMLHICISANPVLCLVEFKVSLWSTRAWKSGAVFTALRLSHPLSPLSLFIPPVLSRSIQEILGSPFVVNDDEVSHMKD